MLHYGLNHPDSVNWWLLPIVVIMFLCMLDPAVEGSKGSAIAHGWNIEGVGPFKTFAMMGSYAMGAAAAGIWSIENIGGEESLLTAVVAGAALPVLSSALVSCTFKALGRGY